jgi:hypothetical protein
VSRLLSTRLTIRLTRHRGFRDGYPLTPFPALLTAKQEVRSDIRPISSDFRYNRTVAL